VDRTGGIAFVIGAYMAANWMTYVQAFHGEHVGTTDQLFRRGREGRGVSRSVRRDMLGRT